MKSLISRKGQDLLGVPGVRLSMERHRLIWASLLDFVTTGTANRYVIHAFFEILIAAFKFI